MLANVGRRVGSAVRRAGRSTAAHAINSPAPVRAAYGLLAGGPIGSSAAVGIPGAMRAGSKIRGSRGMLSEPLTATLQGSRFRGNRALGAMARHPVMTGLGAASAYSYYNDLPGPQRSKRNQNSYYLKQIRQHQRSSALAQVVGSSSGAYA